MAQEVLIIGTSGTGKSTSIEYLDPKSTFIINVGRKSLPFKGWKAKYNAEKKNFFESDKSIQVLAALKKINDMKHIKTVIIDDYQYTMASEYMRRANETGFRKFTDIAQGAWNIIDYVKEMRSDLTAVFMMHSEIDYDAHGNKRTKAKTIGKMMDNVVTLEGLFTVVLYTDVSKGEKGMEYKFCTQNDGVNTAKSPRGMFSEEKIDNNLKTVIDKISEYELG
jgi:hypothetical protein